MCPNTLFDIRHQAFDSLFDVGRNENQIIDGVPIDSLQIECHSLKFIFSFYFSMFWKLRLPTITTNSQLYVVSVGDFAAFGVSKQNDHGKAEYLRSRRRHGGSKF